MLQILNKECGEDFMTITISHKLAFDFDIRTEQLSVIRANGRTKQLRNNGIGKKIFKALYNA